MNSNSLVIMYNLLVDSYHNFRQGEVGDTLHNVIALKKNKKDLVPYTRDHVLGHDYSG